MDSGKKLLRHCAILGWAAEHFESESQNEAGMFLHNYVQSCAEKRDCFVKHQPGLAGYGWLQLGRNFLST